MRASVASPSPTSTTLNLLLLFPPPLLHPTSPPYPPSPPLPPPITIKYLKDVGVLVGDDEHVQGLHGLVEVPHAVGLDEGVLLANAHELGEGCKEALNAGLAQLYKLPGYKDYIWKGDS